ncbi:DUF2461 domain-containing protein [Pedobacter psychrodurus]|uniref:DUF2461 domain-containing protein n=1 Tax=Pedobacter psychrodurus TaxID=2530456 RepID=A0A4R0PW26_9SPHI|nr:DUF2461 domain-containing protein [Pedobacter psychrodurus]TCD26893.1 DUF2461 domain-containing protein [Pedobacter psychrodurus]
MPDIKHIPTSSLDFLRLLKNNNEREWFNDHKTAYQKEHAYIESFAQDLLDLMNTHDVIETPSGKKSLYRIYRDTRFSNDKTPYKTHWSGSFKRAGKQRRGGYYFHIEPGNSFLAGGFFGPSPQDLKLIRENISFDAEPLREILNDEIFISSFETLKGEQLKTAPKGFDGDHQDIDLLRYKQFLLVHRFTDEEVLSKYYSGHCNQEFKNMRPFFDYMSEVLTTDANGMDL